MKYIILSFSLLFTSLTGAFAQEVTFQSADGTTQSVPIAYRTWVLVISESDSDKASMGLIPNMLEAACVKAMTRITHDVRYQSAYCVDNVSGDTLFPEEKETDPLYPGKKGRK